MKKSILKNVAILTFALFGLGIIGNNVMYAKDSLIENPGDGGGNEKGTLVSNQAGDYYCCCDGTRSCSSPACDSTICDGLGL